MVAAVAPPHLIRCAGQLKALYRHKPRDVQPFDAGSSPAMRNSLVIVVSAFAAVTLPDSGAAQTLRHP
jgi:hypothetical protein